MTDNKVVKSTRDKLPNRRRSTGRLRKRWLRLRMEEETSNFLINKKEEKEEGVACFNKYLPAEWEERRNTRA
jgi:hypothetical protein